MILLLNCLKNLDLETSALPAKEGRRVYLVHLHLICLTFRESLQRFSNEPSVSRAPKFPIVYAGHVEEGRRLAAATYLKNLLKAKWNQPDFLSSSERHNFRNQLVDSLLRSDPLVLKALNEAVRKDFYPLTVYSIDHRS